MLSWSVLQLCWAWRGHHHSAKNDSETIASTSDAVGVDWVGVDALAVRAWMLQESRISCQLEAR